MPSCDTMTLHALSEMGFDTNLSVTSISPAPLRTALTGPRARQPGELVLLGVGQ
ncbi:MAG: hypothetical protein OXI95_00950 [bacterium]|nr:hypothetical protein [bacterium]MDE0415489.1 hypothetical protein [bacterium]